MHLSGRFHHVGPVVLAVLVGACASPRAGTPDDAGSSGGADGPSGHDGPRTVERPPPVPALDAAGPSSEPDAAGTVSPTADGGGQPGAVADALEAAPVNPALPHRLQVLIDGDGRVESEDGTISCPIRCSAEFAQPRRLTLKAVTGNTSNFMGWSAGCTGPICTVDVDGSDSLIVEFRSVVAWRQPIGRGNEVAVSGDDVYVVGYFDDKTQIGGREASSAGDRDVFIARFDLAGQLQWLKTFGGAGSDAAQGVTAVPGDQIVVTGDLVGSYLDASGRVVAGEPNRTYPFTAWYSRTGDLRRVIRDVGALAIASDAQGNVALGSVPLAKYSASGSKLWEARDRYNNFLAQKVAFDGAGNLIVANTFRDPVTVGGRTHTSMGANDLIVAKYTPSGEVAWSARFGQQRNEFTTALAVDANGGAYLTGEIYDDSPQQRDVFVVALSAADGSVRWSRIFDRPGNGGAGAVRADQAGNVLVSARLAAGDIGGGVISPGSLLLRLDARTGGSLAAKSINIVPDSMALHASGDVFGATWELVRLTVRW